MGLIGPIHTRPLLQPSLTNKISTKNPKPQNFTMAKKSATQKSNKKKNKKSGPNAISMKQQKPQKENPFETIWSRRKFDILGKKRKGEEIRVGLSRSRGIEKRKKTLLKEYEQSWKASSFVDKRIGEKNEELHEFDKGIMRSQRERQLKLSKKSMYNLSDGEEDDDGFGVSGLGSISGRDDFEDDVAFDDDDDDGEEGRKKKKLAMSNALGDRELIDSMEQEGEDTRHKSKKEVMEEVIFKSKYFKAQKAKDKEENVQLMEELDKSFVSLQAQLSTLTASSKQNALKSLLKKDITSDQLKKKDKLVTEEPLNDMQDKPDSYDKLVKELAMDMRAQPSDRTKTPEEIAQEERERLEKLEEERQKRMQAADDSSDEENDTVEKPLNQRARSISGDDLGDSFSLDEEPRATKGWVDEILEKEDVEDSESSDDDDSSEDAEGDEDDGESEESDGDNDGEEKTMSLKDWEQSDDDDDLGIDLEEDEAEENGDSPVKDKKEKEMIGQKNVAADTTKRDGESLKKKLNQPSSIPFIIQAPKNFEELSSLLGNCSNADVIEIIKRIRATEAIKLAAENRKKMQVFYGLLLQYFAVLASKKPLNLELLNLLVKPLMEISIELPYFSAICARQRIMRTRNQFCEAVKNSEDGCWPSLKILSLLRLWSMIFPCSDFRHPVMTPAILLMCEYLIRCPIKSGRDIAIGSFLCSMVLSVARQSQKYCPEAITFLRTMLMAVTQNKTALDSESQFYHLTDLKALGPLLYVQDCIKEISPLNFMMVMDMAEDSSFFSSDNFRVGVLFTVVETLRGFIDIYGRLSSFPEIFVPISSLLLEVAQQENLPDALQEKCRDAAEIIKKKVDEHHTTRRPLQMRKQKPVPIKLVAPKFEENFVKGRDYDPDRERAERRKLQKLIKQEAKKAARELRKDNHFLATVKDKEQEQWEEERAEKLGRARAFLQEQEHAFKSGQLGKGRKRRR